MGINRWNDNKQLASPAARRPAADPRERRQPIPAARSLDRHRGMRAAARLPTPAARPPAAVAVSVPTPHRAATAPVADPGRALARRSNSTAPLPTPAPRARPGPALTPAYVTPEL